MVLDPLSRADASQLFDRIRSGSSEVLGALEASPVLFVDVDAGTDPLTAIPDLLPCVVVGTGTRLQSASDLAGLDIVLTEEPSPGSIDHLELEEAARLCLEAIESSPVAAVVLAQILRSDEDRNETGDLLFESLAYSMLQSSDVFLTWLASRPEPKADVVSPHQALVLIDRKDDELFLTLNRPERRNALGAKLRDALCQALADASADLTISRIHLDGSGPAFSSGGDLNEFGTAADGGLAHLVRTTRSPGLHIAAQRSRISVHVHGACIGAGIELPAFANDVLAKEGTSFRLPEVGMGLIPGAGGTASIPRRIGRHRMNWLGISGAEIDLDVALSWGLVDRREP